MPVVIPTGYAQITLNYTGPMFVSGRAATVLGFGGQSDPVSSIPDFVDLVVDAWIANVKPQMDSNVRLDSVYWAGPTTSGLTPVGEAGAVANDGPPSNCAALFSYSTGFKGPRGRGRSYIPGLIDANNIGEDGVLNSGAVTAVNTAWGGFLGDLTLPTGPTNLVILQRDEPDQVTPPISPPPPVIAWGARNKLGTQRRRMRR